MYIWLKNDVLTCISFKAILKCVCVWYSKYFRELYPAISSICFQISGIILLDYPVYMRACYEHLSSEKIISDLGTKKYYSRVEKLNYKKVSPRFET